MSSLVSIGNCKLGHDCRRVCSHRRHDEILSPTRPSCEFVFTPPTRRDKQFRPVGVGGVYWALRRPITINCNKYVQKLGHACLNDL